MPTWPVGLVGAWSTLHRGAVGDARGTTRTLNRVAVHDYNYAAATRTYGRSVDGCAQRGRLPGRGRLPPVPDRRHPDHPTGPADDCPAQFGNEDIYGGTYLDPTP